MQSISTVHNRVGICAVQSLRWVLVTQRNNSEEGGVNCRRKRITQTHTLNTHHAHPPTQTHPSCPPPSSHLGCIHAIDAFGIPAQHGTHRMLESGSGKIASTHLAASLDMRIPEHACPSRTPWIRMRWVPGLHTAPSVRSNALRGVSLPSPPVPRGISRSTLAVHPSTTSKAHRDEAIRILDGPHGIGLVPFARCIARVRHAALALLRGLRLALQR